MIKSFKDIQEGKIVDGKEVKDETSESEKVSLKDIRKLGGLYWLIIGKVGVVDGYLKGDG